jgi:hypothetical protein
MSLAGSPNGEWHYLNLLRKVIGVRQIGVAVYEDAADDEYRIGRRRYLLHAARQLSFPIQASNEAYACVRARCARADIGESTSNGSVNCTL